MTAPGHRRPGSHGARSRSSTANAASGDKGIALIYSRTSDADEQELSVDSQEEITKKCVESKGFRVPDDGIYRDRDRSGINLKVHRRERFHAMIDRALSDPSVAAVALYDTSRFARDRVTSATVKAELRRSGIEIIYATQSISDDPDSAIIEAIFEAMDEGQSRKTGRLALRGMVQKAKRGDRLGAAPYGYRFVSWMEGERQRSKLEVVPDEAEVVRQVYDEYLRGAGDKGVVESLNRKGILTRAGKPFRKGTIEGMLIKPAYYGANVFNTRGKGMSFQGVKPTEEWVVVENAHEAIVSRETWDRVQALRKERNPHEAAPALLGAAHALSGLLVHEDCGAKLIIDIAKGRMGKKYVYYTCGTRRAKPSDVCPGIRVPADKLEAYVLDAIYSKLLSDERIEELFRTLEKIRARLAEGRDQKLGEWTRELSRLDAQEERLVGAVAEGTMTPEAVRPRLEKISKQKIESRSRIEGLGKLVDVRQLRVTQDIIVGLRASVQAMIRTKDPRQIRNFLSKFIAKIVMAKDHITIHGSLEKATKQSQAVNSSYHRLAWLPAADETRIIPVPIHLPRELLLPKPQEPRECGQPECHRSFYARDVCRLHYRQLQRGTLRSGPREVSSSSA